MFLTLPHKNMDFVRSLQMLFFSCPWPMGRKFTQILADVGNRYLSASPVLYY